MKKNEIYLTSFKTCMFNVVLIFIACLEGEGSFLAIPPRIANLQSVINWLVV